MPWIELLVIAAVLVGVALMAGGRGAGLAPAPPDRPDRLVDSEPGPLTAEHIRDARFGVGFRGYRMDEVDALLDRVAAELPSLPEPTTPAADSAGTGRASTPVAEVADTNAEQPQSAGDERPS